MRLIRYFLFLKEYVEFKGQARKFHNEFPFGKLYPCLDDRFDTSGSAYGHYFHQDLLVANRIFVNNPEKHVDVGSRIDGFAAHVASFREIEVFDVRPLSNTIHNIIFRQADLMNPEFGLRQYCDSISSLHAIEHFGLGRYGDELDYNGHIKGLDNIYKMLKDGGKFYFSAPIGRQRIEFNAHRVFSVKYLIGIIEKRYRIDSFSYVDDEGDLFKNVILDTKEIENNYSCDYGCAILELTKTAKA
ncbi:DUF268 domain-containing protein [Thermodesulfobacteriota bacterium]